MKTSNKFKTLTAVAVAALAAAACTDTWDEHYGVAGNMESDKSILQLMEEAGDLNDFISVLQNTHVFFNNKSTGVTYAELLNQDQTFTVWAPKDGTFNVDSLLAECATGTSGDSLCGQHFVQNCIAYFVTNSTDTKSVQMLNGKYLSVSPGSFHGVAYEPDRANIPARNGLLHVVDGNANYLYSIYEGLTSLPAYAGIGEFFKHYEKVELDESQSVQAGIVDGQIVYSDSVLVRENTLFNLLNPINGEDSNYLMLVPEAQLWDKVYAEAASHFNYGNINKADSLQQYNAHMALFRNMLFNRNIGGRHINDSIYSISFNPLATGDDRHYVFYKPFEAGGILSSAFVRDTTEASNGVFYNLYEWPFEPSEIYHFPVKAEGENTALVTSTVTGCRRTYSYPNADSISSGFVTIEPTVSLSPDWRIEYDIHDVLSGTYDICAVVLPYSVTGQPNTRPNKFSASVSYQNEAGITLSMDLNKDNISDPEHVDTISLGTFKVPVCTYGQTESKLSVVLSCYLRPAEARTYQGRMLLDCIYLKPSKEE